jgi:ATP-dependent DNA helicase DinG
MAINEALDETIKAEIRDALTGVRAGTQDFHERRGQKQMIAEVAKTLSGCYGARRVLAIEAPTGTGKSVGYLLGAIPVARAQGRSLVVATATVALQEQLIHRDLPDLRERTGMAFRFALAKGRGRYVCNRNLADLAGSDDRQDEMDLGEAAAAAWDHRPSERERRLVTDMDRRLRDPDDEFTGDLDEWSTKIPEALQRQLVTDQSGCTGRACAHFSRCSFYRSRQTMKDADVIVANHNLVLADLELGGGVLLPDPENTLYIFDEGHHLPVKAIDSAAEASGLNGGRETLDSAMKAYTQAGSLLMGARRNSREERERIQELVRAASEKTKAIADLLDSAFPDEGETTRGEGDDHRIWRFPNGEPTPTIRDEAGEMSALLAPLLDALSAQRDRLRKVLREADSSAPQAESQARSLGIVTKRLESMHNAWSLFSGENASDGPPIARWIERLPAARKKAARRTAEYRIAAAPTSAAAFLASRLFNEAAGVVLTSATLTALGRFDRLRERCGLRPNDGTQYLRLPSPFDYTGSAQLVVPDIGVDPTEGERHTEAITEAIGERVDPREGTLVLFSARHQMQKVAESLDTSLRDRLLMQGECSKQAIVEKHRKAMETGRGSVIFGLASFAEGIDLPGRLCTHVVIAKIPFAVPDSPIEATYAEYLKAQGRNAFMEISLPDAAMKLIQACGRLIRSETDTGMVTLLDRRVVTKRYGDALLDSLPPYERVIESGMRKSA